MSDDLRDSLDSYISFQLAELEGCLPLIALSDQEAVHDARLALRRIRSVFSCYKPLLPHVPREAIKDLRWLARSLGEARDEYVLAQRITQWLDSSGAWRSPRPLFDAVETLRSSSGRIAAGLGTRRRAAKSIQSVRTALLAGAGEAGTQEEVLELLQWQWLMVQRSLKSVAKVQHEAERDELLHRLRKDIKRLRYCVEAVSDILGPAATAIIQPAIRMQRILGEQHDSVTAKAWIQGLKGTPGINRLDVQELLHMEHRRLKGTESEFRSAMEHNPLPEPRNISREPLDNPVTSRHMSRNDTSMTGTTE
ncbi:CHAD domain-containing protein [Paenarthrobacter sp. NPDC056912]|uniref:CHAD domain-containing protein n=1 Tax=Paenarthrobacter sp. NPDC056912 TaxID=3345965 RepID=UPI003670BFED